jgi:DNA polymerase I
MNIDVSKEAIEKFLQGKNPQKYIVGVEATYYSNKVDLIINDPKRGKHTISDTFRPFIWMKYEAGSILYNGDRKLTRRKLEEAKIAIQSLKTKNENGDTPDRLENGYRFMLSCDGSYNQILKFLEEGGADVFGEHKELFLHLAPVEQYLIQTGKRMFKGMEDYNDVHRLQFDIETTGLDPKKDRIFQIGIKDNRGYEKVLESRGSTPSELRNTEMLIIEEFFDIVHELKPDIIAGYNSENFDFDFFLKRTERLGYDIKKFAKTLSPEKAIYFKSGATLKLGGETEYYTQTIMWGYNVIDIAHAVRRAQAINSSIKKWGLKYITQFSGVAKPNRVYVPGDIIYKTWEDKENDYAFNNENGEWYKITEKRPLEEGFEVKKGAYIVQRYLLDDLWETEQIDFIYNQASFLISKILPTSYAKSSTMGTASIWKLIMCAWSYQNKLAIPSLEKKRDFTGGLSRLLEVGFAKNVAKMDYAALYPNTELTHGIFPELDITNAMMNMLLYVAETRDEYKALKGKYSKMAENETDPEKKKEYEALASLYDKKQLPLKILANSFFGSFGAPYLFPWGDSDCAEETTCRGRQYLRLLVRFFTDRGFRALVMDTDGVNFAIPDDVDKFIYVSDGTHRFNEEGKEYKGLDAVVAEFNDLYMEGRMGLDIDEIAESTINFARKNYADKLVSKGKTKIKLVGNTVKSKKMPEYIEEFLDTGIKLLLDNKGFEFIEYYYEYVDKIYNYQIPLVKIASKSKVKQSIDTYKSRSKKKNKAGNPLPKQAHMELLIQEGLELDLGDMVYYVNTGTVKSHGDLQTKTNKETGKKEITLNCKLIPRDQIENDPELTTDEYNVPRYLAAFNKRIKPLLVCFHPDIRSKIMIDMVKDKETKTLILQERQHFTRKQSELCAGIPYEDGDQDTYEDLMVMEDKEIYFWTKMEPKGNYPNNINMDDWKALKNDYIKRMIEQRDEDMKNEAKKLNDLIRALEIDDIDEIKVTGEIPEDIKSLIEPRKIDGVVCFTSKKLVSDDVIGLDLVNYGFVGDVIFKYEKEAEERAEYYKTLDTEKLIEEERTAYEAWLEYIESQRQLGMEDGCSGDEASGCTSTILIESEEKTSYVLDDETNIDGDEALWNVHCKEQDEDEDEWNF